MKNTTFSTKTKANILIVFLILLFLIIPTGDSNSKHKTVQVIRDQEIENYLYDLSYPLVKAAKLNPDDINIIIIDDASINAFVPNNNTIVIHLGLIKFAEQPSMLAGVIAHEIGHIASDHLTKTQQAMENSKIGATVGSIIGALAASKSPEGGMALTMGAQNLSQQFMLQHSRTQEICADNAAIHYLSQAKYPIEGLSYFLDRMQKAEEIYGMHHIPFLLTHPLSSERMSNILKHKTDSKKTMHIPSKIENKFETIKSKINAFSNDASDKDLQQNSCNSYAERYQKSIQLFKIGKLEDSYNLTKIMIEEKESPYLYEILGNILHIKKDFDEAIKQYEKSLELIPHNNRKSLIRLQLSMSLIAQGSEQSLNKALKHLNKAKREEPFNPSISHLMGMAYGKLGQIGMSYIYLLEENIILNNDQKSKQYYKMATQHTQNNQMENILLQNIIKQYKYKPL